jgi:nitrous oxidase accessory protein NosD
MENLFFIEKKRIKEYPVLVYSSGYHQISDFIKPLEIKLKEQKYSGIVLLDLLLSNGINNRFYSFIFNGEKFDYKSGKQVTAVPHNVIKIANEHQIKNKIGVENSILSRTEKMRFKHNNYISNLH